MKQLTPCEICGKERYIKPGRIGKYSACRGECYSKLRKIHWNDFYKEKVGIHLTGRPKGLKHTEEAKQKMKESKLGKKHPLSKDEKEKRKQLMAGNKFYKLVKNRPSGENHWNWKGGTRSWKKIIYDSSQYKNWRKAVFERDNYTCKHCNKKGGYLEADHIYPFALYEELRFNVDNGRTLCKQCHIKTPTFSRRIKSREEYERLIKI